MNKQPLVTIIITCYNYDKYVAEAIDSVLEQTYKNIEIIIVNDGSTDKSDEVIRARIENIPHIIYIQHENRGVVYTRNIGIDKAKGLYIVFLDADDKLPKDYIESNIRFAKKNDLDIISTDLVQFGDSEKKIIFPSFNLEHMKNGNILHMSSLIRSSCIGDVRFDEHFSKRSHEDWDFLLGLVLSGARAAKNPSTFLWYRQHGVSRNNTEESEAEKFEFAEVYRDVMHKYSALYHDQVYYLASIRFSNHLSRVYRETIPAMNKKLARQKSHTDNLQIELENIKNSKTYKLAHALGVIVRAVKK